MSCRLKTCRSCLKEVKFESELYEFSSEVSVDSDGTAEPKEFVKISQCYNSVTSVDIEEDTEDLSKICSQCLSNLKFCYLFQKKCWESEKIYSTMDIKEEIIHDVVEYVTEEEYIEDAVNDEDTHDGFEEVGTMMKDEEDHIEEDEEGSQSDRQRYSEAVEQDEAEDAVYPCELCNKVFEKRDYYRRHYRRSHFSQINADTSECHKEGGIIAERPQLHQCDFCGKISVSKDEHEAHQLEHQGEARFKCKKCESKFISKEMARQHLIMEHQSDDKCFNCETCPKSFKNRYQLILHTRSHTGEKPFKCPTCDRCFSMSSNLQKHMDTHSTDKPYECHECHQFFKTQRSLKFHTVCYHEPESKVKCPTCDKSFVNSSYLKMHMLYHTGQKNFTCSICNSKYYKSSHLKRHIQNVHFKLRLMKCEYCASDFVRKETYRAHIVSHHKRHLSTQEYDDVMERIRKFQPPSLDVNKYTAEKQNLLPTVVYVDGDEEGDDRESMTMMEEADETADYEMADEPEAYYEPDEEPYDDEQ